MNKISITINKFYSIVVYTLISLIEIIIFYNFNFNFINTNSILMLFSIVALINILIEISVIKYCEEKIMSFFFVFIICLYLFHFGQVFMSGLFPNYEYDYINYIKYYMPNKEILVRTLSLSINIINFTFIGGILSFNNRLKLNTSENLEKGITRIEDKERMLVHSFSLIIFVLLFPCRLYIDIRQLSVAFSAGYFGSIGVSVPGIIDGLANIWYVSLILLYATNKTPKKKNRIFIGIITYLGIKMLTGNRGHEMVILLSVFIVVILQKNRVSLKKWFLYFVIAYLVLIVIDVVYSFRIEGIAYFFSNWETVLKGSTSRNILLETIGTFGETLYTPYLMLEQIYRGDLVPTFAETFLKSLVSIVPDITGDLANINNSAILGKIIITNHSIGGSYIAEIYYNFQFMYIIFSILFGYIWGKVSNKIVLSLENKEYIKFAYYLPIAVHLLWWTRDSVGNYTRTVVWQILLTWLLLNLIKKRGDYGI